MSVTAEPAGRRRGWAADGRSLGGLFGALAVSAALFRRQTTGCGAHVDLSLLDCQVSLLTYMAQYFLTDGRVPGPMGSSHASVVPYQALATRDGHLIVAVFAEKFWGGFCRAAARPEWEGDPRFATNRDRVAHREVLGALIAARFAEDTTGPGSRADDEGVPAARSTTIDRVLGDPQVTHGDGGTDGSSRHGTLLPLGTPIRLTPRGLEDAAARRPAHRRGPLDLLGYPPERIAELRRAKAVA